MKDVEVGRLPLSVTSFNSLPLCKNYRLVLTSIEKFTLQR